MSHTNRNFVIAYVLLVGLPVLGMVGVLRAGRNLSAPVSVDGAWKIDADAAQFAALPCMSAAFRQNTSVAISQSGRNLALNLSGGSKVTALGVIDGRAVKASAVPSQDYSTETGCGSDRLFTLTATVDTKSDPKSLFGTLSVDGCPSCAPVEFRAVKQAGSAGKGVH